jgi:hypothetical protein
MKGDANAIQHAFNASPAPAANRLRSAGETLWPDAERGEAVANVRPTHDALRRRVFWELRHARLRLALAENDLAWAQELLVSRGITPGVALRILDEVFEDLAGVRP